MKKALYLTVICAALTACGGGSGGGNNGGSDPAPSPTPTPTAQCTLPTIAANTQYYGITPGGDTGIWTFTQSGTNLTASDSGNAAATNGTPGTAFSGTFTAAATSNNCSFVSTTAGVQGITTAFNASGDVAISAAQVGNGVKPAILIANPETSLANAADTYYLVNYETESPGTSSASVTSSYRRIIVNADGTANIARWNTSLSQWDVVHDLRLTTNGQNGFIVQDFNSGVISAQAYFKVSGASKLIALATGDIDPTDNTLTQGLMIGSNSTSTTTLPTGFYVDNTYATDMTDYSSAWTGGVNVSATTIQPSRESAYTMQQNTPTVGFIGLPVDANQPVDVINASPMGLFAAVTQHQGTVQNTASVPSITFGIRPQQ